MTTLRPLRVLLVEDDPVDVAHTRAMLEGVEFSLATAGRLSDALAIASREPLDVVLLDLSLPDGSGLDVLARLQEAAPRVPVVIYSATPDDRTATQSAQAGAQDYLVKGDVSDVSLRRALRYAIERHELRDRLAASIDELERQRSSVLQLNQLKNDLIAVLAHDIKGPLTSIMGFSELLEEGFLEGDAATDAAKTIRANAARLATLASDVLALSRVEHGELEIADERVDLIDLLKNAIDLRAVERPAHFATTLKSAYVRGDAERLRQVFDNLLSNAIKYSPSGEAVDVSLESDGDRFRIAIRDRGIGIPPDEITRLFARFSRASNAKKAKIAGTGIGLFIVKMVVERHGGEIALESTLGSGSTFSVTLPSIDASEALRPMRVTILTPDRGLSRFAAYELRARGFRVREASTLEEVVAGDVRSGDAILVDDPLALAPDIRAQLGPERTVRLIGLDVPASDEWDARLPKPFLVADLLRAVAPDGVRDRLVFQ